VQLSTGFLASRRAITMLELLGNGEICSCWPLQLRRPATQYAAPINDNLVWGLFEDARRGRNSSIYSLGSDISLTIKPPGPHYPSNTHSFIPPSPSLTLAFLLQITFATYPRLSQPLSYTTQNSNLNLYQQRQPSTCVPPSSLALWPPPPTPALSLRSRTVRSR
jgi:hypothetical protein